MVLLNKDKEIERLLDALMQEKRENARLREALERQQRPEGERWQRVLEWLKEDDVRATYFRTALGEDK